MKKFLLCLGPVILAYVIVVVSNLGDSELSEAGISAAVCLIIAGGIISGVYLAKLVYKSMNTEKWVKVTLSILCFLAVGIAYISIGIAGCCGLAVVSLY